VDDTTAILSTRLLRQSDDLLYARLRELLAERGLDPVTCVLADLNPHDGHMELGYLVTDARRVIVFELHYGKGDLNSQRQTAFLWNWSDITDVWAYGHARDQIEDALRLHDNAH
jgi:hypothetical protein